MLEQGVSRPKSLNEVSSEIIGSAIEVHRTLGPGLLESAYEECLCHELRLRGVSFERQVPLPVQYKGVSLECGYRIDLVVEQRVVVELKSVEEVSNIHRAQLLTYLKLHESWLGLLLNFNVPAMKDGVIRLVQGTSPQ